MNIKDPFVLLDLVDDCIEMGGNAWAAYNRNLDETTHYYENMYMGAFETLISYLMKNSVDWHGEYPSYHTAKKLALGILEGAVTK